MVAKRVPLRPIFRVRLSDDDKNDFLGEELLCVARYAIEMQKPLSLPLVILSSELHRAISAKFVLRRGMQRSVQAVRTHGAPNRRCQIIPGTF
jgi:hypothetical protein